MISILDSSDRSKQIAALQRTTSIMGKNEQDSDEYIVASAEYQVTFNRLRNNTEMDSADLMRSSGLDSNDYTTGDTE